MRLRAFCDTNVILNPNFNFQDYEKIYLSIVTIEELDGLKKSDTKGHLARQAIRNIMNADNVEIILEEKYHIASRFLEHKNDNTILNMAYQVYKKDNEVIFLCDDYNLINKSRALNLPCQLFEFEKSKDNAYTGFKQLNGDTDFINILFDDIKNGINIHNFLPNEYLILHNEDTNKIHEYRFDENKFIDLKLPSSKVIKGVNSQQRCVLDLLNNNNIPIKIIAGTYGSGKSYLTTKMALYHIFDKGNYGKMLLLRNPLGSGEEIGFLPGNKEEKIGDFFKCIEQYIDSSIVKDKNIYDYIKKDIPFYIKGMSYGSTYVLVDESEDMDLKILKLIGSRIESDSCVVFCGDYRQSESKYQNNNGLYQLIEKLKGHPLVGIVVMDEDVRSEASKVFADI